jgi:hypothetical protein
MMPAAPRRNKLDVSASRTRRALPHDRPTGGAAEVAIRTTIPEIAFSFVEPDVAD